MAFAPPDRVAQRCLALLADEAARRELETRGEEIMRRRDIRVILSHALDASGVTR